MAFNRENGRRRDMRDRVGRLTLLAGRYIALLVAIHFMENLMVCLFFFYYFGAAFANDLCGM
jgi:hypothetical protein